DDPACEHEGEERVNDEDPEEHPPGLPTAAERPSAPLLVRGVRRGDETVGDGYGHGERGVDSARQ
ncbi:MAG: hypothetical protein ACRD17_09715, partial [Terriglobales bacterium]